MIHEMFFKWVELNHLEEYRGVHNTQENAFWNLYNEEFLLGEDGPARYHGIWVKYI